MFGIAILCFCWFGFLYAVDMHIRAKSTYKDYLFNCVFTILFAIWGFLIMANAIKGKLFGALLFAILGWFVSFAFSKIAGLIPTKKAANVILIVVCIAFACIVFSTEYVTAPEEDLDIPAGSSHACCICGSEASDLYGGDYWCTKHYYQAKGMDGDFQP